MDFNELIGQLVSNFSILSVVLFVLLVAEEVVANLPFFKSNSIGQMLLSTVKAWLMKLWAEKK